jgi:hypothetical protein
MELKELAAALRTPADGDALVEYIFAEPDFSEPEYLAKYFNAKVCRSVFAGGSCYGRHVRLSPSAEILKGAFQRRYVRNQVDPDIHQGESFAPMTAYHGTGSSGIATLIVQGGFRQSHQTMRGKGVYFYRASLHHKAEGYAISNGEDPEGIVIEVTIFAATTKKSDRPRRDKLAHAAGPEILVIKNPLVIFPKAVFVPGAKMLNSSGMNEWQSFAGPDFQRRLV